MLLNLFRAHDCVKFYFPFHLCEAIFATIIVIVWSVFSGFTSLHAEYKNKKDDSFLFSLYSCFLDLYFTNQLIRCQCVVAK